MIFLCIVSPAVADEPGQVESHSGDFLTRSTLTGDWGGVRDDVANRGVTFDANVTQTYQGVVSGGNRTNWEYGGRGDLTLKMDSGKMGLWRGGLLTAGFEGNWGDAVNTSTGALSTVNTNQAFPVVGETGLAVPALNFRQMLSEYGGLFVGKLDTVSDGDLNEFAHGKGDTQFMNLAFNINPVLVLTVPYSTLGAGVIVLPTKDPAAAVVSLGVLSSEGEANTAGFSELSTEKVTFSGEARVRTDFFGRTGHQLVGFTYSNNEFTSLDQRLIVKNSEIAKNKGSWSFIYNFDQYLYEVEKGSGQGVGIFGRFGVSDGNPNPVKYAFSLGLGGKGVMVSRPDDRFGIGWYYIDVDNPNLTTRQGSREVLRNEQGFEAYYSIALTPWSLLTPDVQVVHGAQKNKLDNGEDVDTAVVLGLRTARRGKIE